MHRRVTLRPMSTSQRFNVVQAMAGAPRGGAEAFYVRLICALAGYPQHRQVALIRRDEARQRRLAEAGVTTETFRFGGRLDWLDHWRYRRTLRRIDPEIVMTFMNRATGLTPHGDYRLIARLGHYYSLKYYRHCDYWVGNTQGICDHLVNGGMPAERVFHIANFIDEVPAEPLTGNSLDSPSDAPVLLALGRLHVNKGFDILLQAIPSISDATLWLAGIGPEDQRLRELANELGIAHRVHFLGWRDDVNALMATADLFICPSRHEGIGNIVLEAWFHRCPIVATRSQGPEELITDGHDGLLTPIDDANALAKAVNHLLREPEQAKRLAAEGFKTYQRRFSQPVICEQYLSLFEEVMTRPHPS